MQVIFPRGTTAIPKRKRTSEANGVYAICKALDEAGYVFDQEVSICGCRFDIVVYDGEGVHARCVIEVKRNSGGRVAPKQRSLYARFNVPVILAQAKDTAQLLAFLGRIGSGGAGGQPPVTTDTPARGFKLDLRRVLRSKEVN